MLHSVLIHPELMDSPRSPFGGIGTATEPFSVAAGLWMRGQTTNAAARWCCWDHCFRSVGSVRTSPVNRRCPVAGGARGWPTRRRQFAVQLTTTDRSAELLKHAPISGGTWLRSPGQAAPVLRQRRTSSDR